MLKLPSHLLNKCTELNGSLVQGLHQTIQCIDRRLTSCHCTTQCTFLDVLAVSAPLPQVQILTMRMPTCICLALLYLDAEGKLASIVLGVNACEHKRQLFPCDQ